MKKLILFAMLLLSQPAFGYQAGVGFSWSTIDECFTSTLETNQDKSGKDRYVVCLSRFAPIVEISEQFWLRNYWTVGAVAHWKFLNYNTPNVSSSRGQILPNATFSSINFFGPEVIRDFTSKTNVSDEIVLLGRLGRQLPCGQIYVGLGVAFLNTSNSIYVSSVHTPDGVGDDLVSKYATSHKWVTGGVAQLGYQYQIDDCSLFSISYNYLFTSSYRFKTTSNTAILNGSAVPGPIELYLRRSIGFTVQDLQCSLNYQF